MNEPGATVSVMYALPETQTIVRVDHEPGLTAIAAVERSGLLAEAAADMADDLKLGVWGVAVDQNYRLSPGDRVEISRPLQADPREMRRELISDGRVMGGARPAGKLLR